MKVLLTNNKSEPKIYIEELNNMGVIPIFLSDLNVGIDDVEPNNLDDAIFHNMFYSNITGFVTMTIIEQNHFYDTKDMIKKRENKQLSPEREELLKHFLELVQKYGSRGKSYSETEKTIIISYQGELYPFSYIIPKIAISVEENSLVRTLSLIEYLSNFGKVKTGEIVSGFMLISLSEEKLILDFIKETLIKIEQGVQKVR